MQIVWVTCSSTKEDASLIQSTNKHQVLDKRFSVFKTFKDIYDSKCFQMTKRGEN